MPAAHIDDTYYAVKLGNSWTYEINLGAAGKARQVETITKITPVASGNRVTFTRRYTYSNPRIKASTNSQQYEFRKDGSLSVPIQTGVTSSTSKATLVSGGIGYPTPTQFAAATVRRSTAKLVVQTAGHTVPVTADIAVKGAGTTSVTVPAGRYLARRLDQTIVEKFAGQSVTLHTRTLMVKGLGPVQIIISGLGTATYTSVLVSFHKG